MDPELEMALRISLEEERLRQDHIRQNYGAEAPMQQEAPAQAQEFINSLTLGHKRHSLSKRQTLSSRHRIFR